MINKAILILLFLIINNNLLGQNVTLFRVDSLKVLYEPLLRNYWDECQNERYFFMDKGVVKVIVYQDTLMQNCLSMSALIDDGFLENPPDSYFFLNYNLYLVFKGNASGIELQQTKDKQKLKIALNNLVQDRVYVNPSKTVRYAEERDFNGKIKRVRAGSINMGNHWNHTIIIFDKNGKSFKKLKSC
jgi:hypothetical protein